MRYTHDGLTLWYGTEDTPAPEGIVDSGETLRVVAGVSPARPSNTVSVLYRVGQGFERTVRASLLRTDYGSGLQYFQAFLPKFSPGSTVDYSVICESCGLRVPDPRELTGLDREFEVLNSTAAPSNQPTGQVQPNPQVERFPFRLEYFCHFTIYLGGGPPEIIGETPEGIKVNWYISSGEFVGPKLNGKVRSQGGDWMTIRRDGIGFMDVRATLETLDGALIYIEYTGYFELGENGYDNFLKKKWPATPPTRTNPRLHTDHHKYRWLNRIHCIGIGRVIMSEPIFEYDLYGVL